MQTTRLIGFAGTKNVIDCNIAPQRIGVAGYAEFRPVAPNDTAENRALNRRIDLVVLNTTQKAVEEPESLIQGDSSLRTLLDQLPSPEDSAASSADLGDWNFDEAP